MRNVTITLDEETARWARIEAAKRDTSVSRLVGELLREQMVAMETYEHAHRSYRNRQPAPLTANADPYPDRADLHRR